LEKIGEFQGADVAALGADLALEIANDPLEIRFVKAGVEEFVPEALAIKAQAHALAREPAIERVSLLDPLDHEPWRARPGRPGTCSIAC
jgi:hypothetical protein